MSIVVPSVGDKATAAWADSVANAVNALQGASACRIKQSTLQTLTTAVAAAVTFDASDEDTDAGHSNVTNNSRYTVQTGWAGLWEVSGVVSFASNATGKRSIDIRINGSTSGYTVGYPPVNGATTQIGISALVRLVVGDYVELYATQTSGGNLNTDVTNKSYLHMNYIRA